MHKRLETPRYYRLKKDGEDHHDHHDSPRSDMQSSRSHDKDLLKQHMHNKDNVSDEGKLDKKAKRRRNRRKVGKVTNTKHGDKPVDLAIKSALELAENKESDHKHLNVKQI